jgi:hypothetical protein
LQHRGTTTATPRSVRPLGLADYGTPVAWWGWSWEPPVPMSITELVAARDMDARTAALCWLTLAGHGSLLVAAEDPHSGKTTALTAMLDLLPERTTKIYLRGGAETFDFLGPARPAETLLLVNELSSHLPVYLWGAKAVRAFRGLRDGYALAATLHADSADEAIAQLRDELGADPDDLARVDLLVVMRLGRAADGPSRRIVGVHRLAAGSDGPRATPLVTHDPAVDFWTHDRDAEAALVAGRYGWTPRTAERAIEQRAWRIEDLMRRGVFTIDQVKADLLPLNDASEGDRS